MQIGWLMDIAAAWHVWRTVKNAGFKYLETRNLKVKTVVEFFRNISRASSALKAMIQQLGEPALSLKQDVVTRWNSTYDMLQRVLDVKNSLMSTIAVNYPEIENSVLQMKTLSL
jgi:hypothetical protein